MISRTLQIEIIVRSSALLLLALIIWFYPIMWQLGAVWGFALGFVWCVVISSFQENAYRSIALCVCIGVIAAILDSTFDIIKIFLVGCCAAFLAHSRTFSLPVEGNRFKVIFTRAVLRMGRSSVAFWGGVFFLFLPFPRNPVDPAGGGEITGCFTAFLFITLFMIVPVVGYDLLVPQKETMRRG